MTRYVLTAAAGLLVLGAVLLLRDTRSDSPPAPPRDSPRADEVEVREVPGGRSVTVRHRILGQASRASLVYEKDGRDHVAGAASSCEGALARPRTPAGGGAVVLELEGRIPHGASRVRLVLEDETGVRTFAVTVG